ncbi:MAG: hypothetical protein Q9159_003026 [Coniocarpon cinnabarinum]
MSTITLIASSPITATVDITDIEVARNLATVLCIPAVPQILQEFRTSNSLSGTILVSVWELGEAVGPLLTAPLSEVVAIGRSPVYNSTNLIFVIFSLACALSVGPSMLIAFRFFNGIGDASLALNASIVGDMFAQEERGLPIAVMGFPPLIGPVAGPVIGSYLTQAKGWRWAFWLSVITGGVCTIAFATVYRETYPPHLVLKYAKKSEVRKNDPEMLAKHARHAATAQAWRLVLKAIIRPMHMLVGSRVVLVLAVYVSVVYGFLYVLLTTIVEVFEEQYGFSQGAAGLAYLGLSTGMVTAVLLCALTLDRYMKIQRHKTGTTEPEQRLPVMLLGSLLIPIGLFIYGWTAQKQVFFIVPIIGTATVGFGFFATTVPLQAYLVDAFKEYAASAIAATVVCRCVVGAIMPLAGPHLYARLGLGWGNSLLGFIAIAFVPVPILFMRYGKRMRAVSEAEQINQAD